MKKSVINEINDLLNKSKKRLTVESLVFDENDEPGYDAGIGDFEEEPQPETNNVAPQKDETTDIINKIRILALQGIAKLAETPESKNYDLLKKVWQLIDKSVEANKKPTSEN